MSEVVVWRFRDKTTGLVHGAFGYMILGAALCGYPPHGNRLTDPAPDFEPFTLQDLTCPVCIERSPVARTPLTQGITQDMIFKLADVAERIMAMDHEKDTPSDELRRYINLLEIGTKAWKQMVIISSGSNSGYEFRDLTQDSTKAMQKVNGVVAVMRRLYPSPENLYVPNGGRL